MSNWRLARTVSRAGQLGVVSGTALDILFTRRLQEGDQGGHLRRAVAHFPVPEVAQRVYDKYFVEGGITPGSPYAGAPMSSPYHSIPHQELMTVANFAEVWLAKEGHEGVVGINLLEKVQTPTIISLYGAMLAGVDYVLMGAGIPREIPGVLDRLARHEETSLRLDVDGALPGDNYRTVFDPKKLFAMELPPLKRPFFLPIISSLTLALTLLRKSTGKVDGFIIEDHTAGGHNAPPRGGIQLDENKEPIYGTKDEVDLEKIKEMGLPYWVAGCRAYPEKLKELLEQGASGIQVGTVFAFCEESGHDETIKRKVLELVLRDECVVYTDPFASPTGFPFKVVQLDGTMADDQVYEERVRLCDLGYLRHPYRREDGTLGYRCTAEPIADYLRKGGDEADTLGRKCLCNGLMANINHPQVRKNGYRETALVTAGEDIAKLKQFISADKPNYSALEVIDHLLSAITAKAKE